MAQLEQFKISNFRGFDSLEIDGLSKVNLFVGKNNSGKTSILEALFLMSGTLLSDLPSVINSFRGFGLEEDAMKYLFYNMSYRNKPSFYGKFSDGSEKWLELEATVQSGKMTFIPPSQIKGIKFLFSFKDSSLQEPEKSSVIYENNNISLNFEASGGSHKWSHVNFISANKNEDGMRTMLSNIILRKEEGTIIKMLQDAFGDSIIGVRVVGKDIYFDMKDMGELVSINSMGEGVRRFLTIISNVLDKPSISIEKGADWLKVDPVVIDSKAFVCIDEIENGLHYSAHKNLWKGLLSAVSQSDIQLFITTHNIEVLSSLKTVLEEDFTSMQNDVAAFSIAKTKMAGYKSYQFTYDALKDVIEYNTEIRD